MRAINSNQQNHRKIHALSRLEKHVTEQIIYLRESVANVVFFLRSNYLKESEQKELPRPVLKTITRIEYRITNVGMSRPPFRSNLAQSVLTAESLLLCQKQPFFIGGNVPACFLIHPDGSGWPKNLKNMNENQTGKWVITEGTS